MNKTVIVGDIHLGKKSINQVRKDKILESQHSFFISLRKYCTENSITEIIWTGDIFDTQIAIESNIIEYAVELFADIFSDITHHIIVGNHDIYLKDSLDISSLACLRKLSNVNVYRKPTRLTINGKNFLMTPYLVSSINKVFTNNIETIGKKYDVVVGHFDIIGAKMESGFVSEHGLDMSILLKNIKLTISGHYHNISNYSNGVNKIQYVGTPYQLTFGDAGDIRGFWTIDGDLNMEFIENNVSAKFIQIDIDEVDSYNTFENMFVECTFPSNIEDKELFKICKKIEIKKPISFKTIPKTFDTVEDLTSEDEDEKTTEVFNDMCDALNVGDFITVCNVYIEVEPPKNATLVKELLLKIKEKTKHGKK